MFKSTLSTSNVTEPFLRNKAKVDILAPLPMPLKEVGKANAQEKGTILELLHSDPLHTYLFRLLFEKSREE